MSARSFLQNFRGLGGPGSNFVTVNGMGIVCNLIASLFLIIFNENILWISIGIVFLVVSLSIFALIAYRAQRVVTPKHLVPEGSHPEKHPGLILLVGPGRPGEDPMSQSAGDSINYHRGSDDQPGLQFCWLVTSEGEKGGLPVAQQLKTRLDSWGINSFIRTVKDPFSNIQESYDLVNQIYESEVPDLGLGENQVISDFTGATKPMSAGMILACGEKRPMQYMYGRKEGVVSEPRLMKFVLKS